MKNDNDKLSTNITFSFVNVKNFCVIKIWIAYLKQNASILKGGTIYRVKNVQRYSKSIRDFFKMASSANFARLDWEKSDNSTKS